MHAYFSLALVSIAVLAHGALLGCGGAATPPAAPSKTRPIDAPERAPVPALLGTLVGYDGQPMLMAHVSIDGDATQVEANGSFRIPVTHQGLVVARFTGVDHGDFTAVLLMSEGDVDIKVTLGTYEAPKTEGRLSVVQLRFAKDGAVSAGKVTPLARRPDGSFRATVRPKGTTYAYEIRGTTASAGLSMNGTARTVFRYDGAGNYCNVIEGSGAVEIVFDPTKTLRPGVETELTFAKPLSRAARVAQIFSAEQPSKILEEHVAIASAEQDPVLSAARSLALFAALEAPPAEPSQATRALAQATLRTTAADSPLWKAAPSALAMCLAIAGADSTSLAEAVVNQLLKSNSIDAAAEAAFLLLGLAESMGESTTAAHYYELFGGPLAASEMANFARQLYDPSRAIRPGQPLPDFSLTNVDTQANVSKRDFEGKVLLLDFWATWCGPCIRELPNLHATYAKYRDQGFEILSINIKDQPGNSQAMRAKGTFPMPWTNVVLGSVDAGAIAGKFEVSGLPTMILVGRDGTIRASAGSLRGHDLGRKVAVELARASKQPPT